MRVAIDLAVSLCSHVCGERTEEREREHECLVGCTCYGGGVTRRR